MLDHAAWYCVLVTGLALQQCVSSVCLALSNSTNELNQLDRGCGDGDCGTTITNGVNGMICLLYTS